MNLNPNKTVLFCLAAAMLLFGNDGFGSVSDSNSLVVSITPLANNTGLTEYDPFAEGFSDLLTAALSDYDNIHVVERQVLNQVMKEQKLSLTDLIRPDTALRVGKLLKADAIMTGGLTKPKDDFIVNVHVYEIDTARLTASEMIQGRPDTIAEQTYVLASHIFDRFGVVLAPVDPNEVDADPKAALHFMRGLGCFYTADYDRSIVHFMKAIRSDAQSAKARLWLARAYMENGDDEHAGIELKKIIAQFPSTAEASAARHLQKELKR
jgi:TolB-like protein